MFEEGMDQSTACSTTEEEDVKSVISLHSAFSEEGGEEDHDVTTLRNAHKSSSNGLAQKNRDSTVSLEEENKEENVDLEMCHHTAATVDPSTQPGEVVGLLTSGINRRGNTEQQQDPGQQHFSRPAHQQFRTQIKSRKQQHAAPYESDAEYDPTSSSEQQSVIVLGMNISHLSPMVQFLVCASGVFGFNLTFGFLQEFVTVEICNRELGLFLAMMQFTGYTGWSYLLRNISQRHQRPKVKDVPQMDNTANNNNNNYLPKEPQKQPQAACNDILPSPFINNSSRTVPTRIFMVMGLLSAIDMAMTNMALHYINYPAKTLMKSCRVIFTMFFGIILIGKQYRLVDYVVVLGLIAGLAIFMQADASSSAIFEPIGVLMLTVSLLCDGATNIMSESTMKSYGIGQDELIFRMFSLALIAVSAAAIIEGDLYIGIIWLLRPGTYDEWKEGADDTTWSVAGKIAVIVLFSSMGFFGSSCSAAITKNFGALAMSMTSTARRAATLFISFFMFDNQCTYMHLAGIFIFIVSLSMKSAASRSAGKKSAKTPLLIPPLPIPEDPEIQKTPTSGNGPSISRATLGRRGTVASPSSGNIGGRPVVSFGYNDIVQ